MKTVVAFETLTKLKQTKKKIKLYLHFIAGVIKVIVNQAW